MNDKDLACIVVDHRGKFQGSWALQLWKDKWGDKTPEEVYGEDVMRRLFKERYE